jgi:hypothetical protein
MREAVPNRRMRPNNNNNRRTFTTVTTIMNDGHTSTGVHHNNQHCSHNYSTCANSSRLLRHDVTTEVKSKPQMRRNSIFPIMPDVAKAITQQYVSTPVHIYSTGITLVAPPKSRVVLHSSFPVDSIAVTCSHPRLVPGSRQLARQTATLDDEASEDCKDLRSVALDTKRISWAREDSYHPCHKFQSSIVSKIVEPQEREYSIKRTSVVVHHETATA